MKFNDNTRNLSYNYRQMIKLTNIKKEDNIISLHYFSNDTNQPVQGNIVFDIKERKIISGEECIDRFDFGKVANIIQSYIDEGKEIPETCCRVYF